MSYHEYNDLFDACQNTAPYHMFIYDVQNSKAIQDKNRQEKLLLLIHTVYQRILQLEQVRKQTIIHRNSLFDDDNPIGYLREPILIDGDTIGFTIMRDSMTADEVNELFYQVREELNIPYEFHLADGYYETDLYEEGNTKYFRGYCIQYLNTLHKRKKEL